MMPERDAWRAVWEHWRGWLANVLGGAGLLAAAYGWFWIPDEKIWHLALSAVMAMAIAGGIIWLAGASAGAMAGSKARYRQCAVWLGGLVAWAGLIQWLGAGAPRQGAWLASLAAMMLRKPLEPAAVTQWVALFWTAILWLGFVALVPYLSLTWREASRSLRRKRYWAAALAGVFTGFWLPWQLFQWAPGFEGFNVQIASLAIRLAIAWTVMVTAWLWLLALPSRHAGSTATSSS